MNASKNYLRELIHTGKTGELEGITTADNSETPTPSQIIVESTSQDTLLKCLKVLNYIEQSHIHTSTDEPEGLRILEILESEDDLNALADKLFPKDEFLFDEENPFGDPLDDIAQEAGNQANTKILENRSRFRAKAKEILSDETVKDTFMAILRSEVNLLTGFPGQDKESTPLGQVQKNKKLQLSLQAIKSKISQLYLADKRTKGKLSPDTTEAISRLTQKQAQAERQIDSIDRMADDTTRSWLQVDQLQTYKNQLDTMGFAVTPSRQMLIDRVMDGVSRGEKMFLVGSTGTGKTQMAILVAMLVNQHGYELVSWHEGTGIRDLFGYRELNKDTQGNITSGTKPGPVTLAITEGKIVVHDEYTNGLTRAQLSQKAVLNAKPGSKTTIPGFNGNLFSVSQNFGEIFTGNPKNEKTTKEREELDPAINRMLTGLKVDFMPPDEMLAVILGSIIDDTGIIPIPPSGLKLLEKLTKAAEFMQKCHDQDFADIPASAKTQFATIFGGSIDDLHLNKNFLDTGTILRLLNGWDLAQARGESFAKFLSDRLNEFKNDPKFSEAPEEKQLVETILNLSGLSNFSTESNPAEPPFILPSQLSGILNIKRKKIDVAPIASSTEQDLADIASLLELPPAPTPPETTPELQKFKEDYENSKLTLDFFELTQKAKTPMPTWEQIQPRLTPEVLQKAKNLHQPKLICIPTRDKQDKPLRYQELAQSLNQAKANGKTSATHTGGDTYIWNDIQNGTKVQYQNQSQADYFKAQPDWQVYLVEAADNMPTPDQLPNNLFPDFPTNGTNQAKFDYMLAKYQELNVQSLTYEMWAILLMDALRQGQVIDGSTFTCLLANKLDVTNVLPAAGWFYGRPHLDSCNSGLQHGGWSSRAAVRVM